MILKGPSLRKLRSVPDQVLELDNYLNLHPLCLGGSVFAGVTADLFVTGEMGHHQVLEICDRQNAQVLLTEHSNCERGYLRDVFVPLLKEKLNGNSDSSLSFDVVFSDVDIQDPLSII